MKHLFLLGTLGLVSCASDIKDWEMSDPNDSAMMANDISNPRLYRSDAIGLERQSLSDREMRGLTHKKDSSVKISGELSVGVGKRF
ncbi:MAG: hypothetical protein H7A51_10120 [Akkermansiaceae bacterium]|nr:hypothetical protein [Akkermansiaceae bacterium]